MNYNKSTLQVALGQADSSAREEASSVIGELLWSKFYVTQLIYFHPSFSPFVGCLPCNTLHRWWENILPTMRSTWTWTTARQAGDGSSCRGCTTNWRTSTGWSSRRRRRSSWSVPPSLVGSPFQSSSSASSDFRYLWNPLWQNWISSEHWPAWDNFWEDWSTHLSGCWGAEVWRSTKEGFFFCFPFYSFYQVGYKPFLACVILFHVKILESDNKDDYSDLEFRLLLDTFKKFMRRDIHTRYKYLTRMASIIYQVTLHLWMLFSKFLFRLKTFLFWMR